MKNFSSITGFAAITAASCIIATPTNAHYVAALEHHLKACLAQRLSSNVEYMLKNVKTCMWEWSSAVIAI